MMENKLKLARIKANRRKARQNDSERFLERLEAAAERIENQKVDVEVDTTELKAVLGELELSPTFNAGDVIVDTEVFSREIAGMREMLKKGIRQPSEIREPLNQLIETLKLKPSQEPSEFIPYRRVVLNGGRLQFDDAIGGGGSWAGGSSDSITSVLPTYGIARINDSSNPAYYGFEDNDGNWYVLRQNDTMQTWKYAVGTGGIATVWINNSDTTYTGLTYVDKGAAF